MFVLSVFEQNAGTDKSVFPLPEPQDVFLAAQVKFDDLDRDLRQFERDLTSTLWLNSNWSLFKNATVQKQFLVEPPQLTFTV